MKIQLVMLVHGKNKYNLIEVLIEMLFFVVFISNSNFPFMLLRKSM